MEENEMPPKEELEWAYRGYQQAVEHLVEVLEKGVPIPTSVYNATMALAHTITQEWS